MRRLAVVALVLVLVGLPVVAAPSALSFAIELSAGTVAAAVPFYIALFGTSDAVQPLLISGLAVPSAKDIVLGLAVPPLAAGVAVACVGRAFGVTGRLAGVAAILAASVGETFALQLWQLDLPGWMKTIAVPVITSLGATIAFNRQVRPSR